MFGFFLNFSKNKKGRKSTINSLSATENDAIIIKIVPSALCQVPFLKFEGGHFFILKIFEIAKKSTMRAKTADEAVYAFAAIRELEKENFKQAHKLSVDLHNKLGTLPRCNDLIELNRNLLLFNAPYNFDSFCQYIELDRDPKSRFYMPRRKQLIRMVNTMQKLEDGELDIAGIMMPPGTGKSTTAIFYLTWLAGRNPDMPILGGSHSNAFLRGVYDECLRIMAKGGEYLWRDVFPGVCIARTNAQDMMIDMYKPKRFATLEFSSIGSGNAGKVRAQKLLYCDDLVSGIEEAMSRERMDKLWQLYTTDLRQRKIGECRELHIATPWSLHDPMDRLERNNENNPRAEFLHMPALNEEEKSNFDYANGVGFSTKFYIDMRESMDDASWRALFMTSPIEREGQLYPEDQLRRYFELPDKAPEAIIAVCDTKEKGSDYAVLPVAYKYGDDFYIEECVCDNGAPDVVETRLWMVLVKHKVQLAQFESNSAGGKVAEKCQQEVKAHGGITRIVTRYTTANKETKIIVNSPWVMEHCLFKDNSVIKNNKEYRRVLSFLTGYTMAGKNRHDDVPDAFAMLAQYAQGLNAGKVEIGTRIW